MARRLRVDYHGAIHHVMNRGINHQPVFFGDEDRIEFGRRLADIHERFGVETLAYCLMANHYHLLLRTPTGQISDAMQRLGALYTQHTNGRAGRDGPIFRGRFHSKLDTTDSYLRWLTRYVHRNPLDITAVQRPSAYRWSSYRSYLGHRSAPPFLDLDVVLELFGRDRSTLAEFTDADVAAVDPQSVTAVDDLVQFVEFTVACHQLADTSGGAAHPWYVRTLLILPSDHPHLTALRPRIDRLHGFPDATARRKAVARARHRAAHDPQVARLLTEVTAEIVGATRAA